MSMVRKEHRIRAEELVAQMSLEEKAGLCSGDGFWHLKGVGRLGIPAMMVTDGPHGLRRQDERGDHLGVTGSVPATCFPPAVTMAATWNRQLIRKLGAALGEECLSQGVSVVLGPGANIKRSPLCGRNFEYFSEDPYLSGELAAAHIRGVQSSGVGTSLKHYAANNQENGRLYIDTVADERTLFEIYLSGFQRAVEKGHPDTVMAAYNRLNGVYCTENAWLLTDLLRDKWGFEGVVVSDWGAVSDRVKGVAAGMDLEMPGSNGENDRKVIAAVSSGELPLQLLDRAAQRITALLLAAEESIAKHPSHACDWNRHHAIAAEVAAEGAVLLRNEQNLLPLSRDVSIALIGSFARNPRYQGAGSSMVNPTRLDTLYDALHAKIGSTGFMYARGYGDDDAADTDLIDEACAIAGTADVTIVIAGLPDAYESEGFDRDHMRMPESHVRLIEALSAVTDSLVVVLYNGSPVEMPWIDGTAAVLEGYLGGQAGGAALADILFGDINPSGRLAESFPLVLADTPSYGFFPGERYRVQYREGLHVGYRYYDSCDVPVRFPFGFGLSYTTFTYESMSLSRSEITSNEQLLVMVTVRNSGKIAGSEVVQLYVQDSSASVYRPKKELKGFDKLFLQPGEQQRVTFELDEQAFSLYDPKQHRWVVESGEFMILAGSSVADIHLQKCVTVKSADVVTFSYPAPSGGAAYSEEEFSTIYGKQLAHERPPDPMITRDTPLSDVLGTQIGQQLYAGVSAGITRMFGDGGGASGERTRGEQKAERMFRRMIDGLPVRAVAMFSGGTVSLADLEGMITMMNQELQGRHE